MRCVELSILLATVSFFGVKPAHAQDEKLAEHTFIETTDGKIYKQDLRANQPVEILFTVSGIRKDTQEKFTLTTTDLINRMARLDILTPRSFLTEEDPGQVLLVTQEGKEVHVVQAVLNGLDVGGWHNSLARWTRTWKDDVSNREMKEVIEFTVWIKAGKWGTGWRRVSTTYFKEANQWKYLKSEATEVAIQRIVFARVLPLRCPCGRLLPPDYKYCPYDGRLLTGQESGVTPVLGCRHCRLIAKQAESSKCTSCGGKLEPARTNILDKGLDYFLKKAGVDPASEEATWAKKMVKDWLNPFRSEAEILEDLDWLRKRFQSDQ